MSHGTDFKSNVIIELGSNSIKCGIAEEDCPRFVIPNVIGTPKKEYINIIDKKNNIYYGRDALKNSCNLDISYPLIESNGKFPLNGDALDKLEGMFKYIFEKKLQINIQEYGVFIVDSLFTSAKERYALVKLLFEKFGIYHVQIEPQSVMSFYLTAKSTGLFVGTGELFTEVVPIYEGYMVHKGVLFSPIAGKEMTNQFLKCYKQIFDMHCVSAQFDLAQTIKEEFIELKESKIDNLKDIPMKQFILPDGNSIEIGSERFTIPELLFDPTPSGIEAKGIHEMIFESIDNSDIMLRKEFFNNLILYGGNSMIKGLDVRLKNEMEQIIKKTKYAENTIKVNAFNDRKYGGWVGASGFCTFGHFKDKWITKIMLENSTEDILRQNYLFGH